MKKPIKKILIIIGVLILISITIKIFDFIGLRAKDKAELELADVKIGLLESENVVLVQRHAQDSIRIDSLTLLIERGKFEVDAERERRLALKKENDKILSKFEELSENDQVKDFIASTGEGYDIMKYDGYYLISLESIQFAKRSFIKSELQLKQITSLQLEIKSFNEMIRDYDKRFEVMTSSYISDMNQMLANKDQIINNLNLKIGVYEKSFGRLKLTKGITIGVGIAAIGILLIK